MDIKLIKNADVYEPEHLGKRDILIAGGKIQKIAESIELPEDLDAEVIDAGGLAVTPGFIDCHVHVLGGGGEGGFAFRTPEGTLSGFTRYGITTVVGCLGTDGIAREMTSLAMPRPKRSAPRAYRPTAIPEATACLRPL